MYQKLSLKERTDTFFKLQYEYMACKNPIPAKIIIYDGDKRNYIYGLIHNDDVDNLLENRCVTKGVPIVIYNEDYYNIAEEFYRNNSFLQFHGQQIKLTNDECELLGIEYPAFI
jgi:hypothetical protein